MLWLEEEDKGALSLSVLETKRGNKNLCLAFLLDELREVGLGSQEIRHGLWPEATFPSFKGAYPSSSLWFSPSWLEA
jgi:hypothetical protein